MKSRRFWYAVSPALGVLSLSLYALAQEPAPQDSQSPPPQVRAESFPSDQMRVAVAIRRGEQLFEVSEFGEALKEYQKALDANRISSLAHYRIAEVFQQQRNYQSAANEFRAVLEGDLHPKWTEVWSHVNLGRIFDVTGQRGRAVNEYKQAERTKDNTQGALEEAAKYLKTPYERPKHVEVR